MMIIENLRTEASEDTEIKMTEISTYSLTLPNKTVKWLRYLSEAQISFESVDIELRRMRKKRIYYYKHDYDLSLTATEVKEFTDGDSEYQKVKVRHTTALKIITFIEGVIKILNASSFNVKNVIEYEKFKVGGY